MFVSQRGFLVCWTLRLISKGQGVAMESCYPGRQNYRKYRGNSLPLLLPIHTLCLSYSLK